MTSAVNGYIAAQLWAGILWPDSGDNEPTSIDQSFSREDVPDQYVMRVYAYVSEFVVANYEDSLAYCKHFDDGEYQFGYDLYLTREHHGTGLWDRGVGDAGERLTSAADATGDAAYPYVDEFGKLQFDVN